MAAADPAFAGTQQVRLDLPDRLVKFSSEDYKDSTKWFVFQILDTELDWRNALEDAHLRLDGNKSALHAPNIKGGLGLLADEEAAPHHMLVLKPQGDKVLPAGRVSACLKLGSLLPKPKSEDIGSKAGLIKLKPGNEDEMSKKVPLVFWKLGPSIPEDELLQTLSFQCRKKMKTVMNSKESLKLWGSFEVAPKMRLVGIPLAMKGAKYLVGGMNGNSSSSSERMHLYEAEVYFVERDGEFGRNKREEEKQEVEERKVLDFKTQRGEAIKLSGAAQKRRQEASKELRLVDESKVADMEDCLAELNSRVDGTEDMATIKENDSMKVKEQLLPQFDRSALETQKIYAKGLQNMLPSRMLAGATAFLNDRMAVMLQKPSRITSSTQKELLDVFKSNFGVCLARARAEAMGPASSVEDAELTAKRFAALNFLIKLYRSRKPRYKLGEFMAFFESEGYCNVATGFSKHMFEYFLEESPTDRRTRKVHKKKLVCHIIVFMLDVSLGYKINYQPLLEELGMDTKEMEQNLRYVGCEIHRKADNMITELKAPLIFQQAKGEGRGKRKRA